MQKQCWTCNRIWEGASGKTQLSCPECLKQTPRASDTTTMDQLPLSVQLNRASLFYDRAARELPKDESRGKELVPFLLDYLLTQLCSEAVALTCLRAIVTVFGDLPPIPPPHNPLKSGSTMQE